MRTNTTDPRGPRYTRRRVLLGATAAGGLAVAGCTDASDGGDAGESDADGDADDPEDAADDLLSLPEIEDPPAAVYRPTHREEMLALESVVAGDYAIAPSYTYPHPFWTYAGDIERHDPTSEEDVHLMLTVRDRETGAAVPVDAGVGLDVYDGDDLVRSTNGWLMLSQQMGVHVGDNVPLDGDGTYRVEGRLAPIDVRRTGAFAGRFDDPVAFAFELPFDRDALRDLVEGIEYFPEEEWGDPGALEPMNHDDREGAHGHGDDDYEHGDDDAADHVPDDAFSALPPAETLPGTLQGTPESGDAVLATTLLEPGSRFVDGDEPYLAVSPRTPYNRCALPLMGLEATLDGADGTETVALVETLDDELGHHYGAPLPPVSAGDELTLEVRTPPQVARHRGYETAFVDMPAVTVGLSP